MANRTRLVSLNDAIEGVIHAVRSQQNLRIHFLVAALALLLSAVLGVTRSEFLILTLVISSVLAVELINSAIEDCVDLITDHYHPLAKRIKDVAAGAVLISAVTAVICGFMIFYHRLAKPISAGILLVKQSPPNITLVALVLVIILVVAGKARFGRGTPMAGGMPSGHAAVSFSIFTIIALVTEQPLVILLTFCLAAMVSQSRLFYRVHTLREVIMGALLGSLLTLLLFQLFT